MSLKDTCDELEEELTMLFDMRMARGRIRHPIELAPELERVHIGWLRTLVKLASLEAKLESVDAWKGYASEDEVEATILRFEELKKRVEAL